MEVPRVVLAQLALLLHIQPGCYSPAAPTHLLLANALSSSGEEKAQLLDDQEPQGLRAEAVGWEGAARDSPRAGLMGFVSALACVYGTPILRKRTTLILMPCTRSHSSWLLITITIIS